MLRATLKSLAARRLRLLLTATAIVLGVTFVTGTLVLTDTSTRLFDDQFAQATAGVDLVVRDDAAFGAAMGVEVDRDPVPTEVLERITALPGVAGAQGIARGSALLVIDGEPVIPSGATLGQSWTPDPYTPFTLRRGRQPRTATEIVIDQATATAQGMAVGDTVEVALDAGTRPFELVGTVGFGDADGMPTATTALFAPPVAQELFATGDGWSEVQVIADGIGSDQLRERVIDELGDDYEVTTSKDTAADSAAAAQVQLLYLRLMLLVLAATSLLVGAFMIANTFAIVVGQRTREFATLRALGANQRQVLTSVLAEAVVVGTVASAAGAALGIATASGLRTLAGRFGVVIPDGPLTVQPRTLLTGMIIGVLVTLASAIVPARRAARTAPVEAMRDVAATSRPISQWRVVAGGVLGIVGVAALTGAATGPQLGLIGPGGLGVLAATVVLAPAFAGPAAAAIGAVAGRDVVGRLARTNVARDRRRTATTSVALAIGLAVVSFMTVVASSARAATIAGVDDVIEAEFMVHSARNEMLGGLSPELHERLGDVDGVAAVSRMRYGHWQHDGNTQALTAIDPSTFPDVAKLDLIEGQLHELSEGGVVLAENVATDLDLHVGDQITMTFSRVGDRSLEVVGIMDEEDTWAVSTGYVISLGSFAELFAEDVDATVFVKLADGADPSEVRADLEQAIADYPTAEVYDQSAATAQRTRMLDSMLGLVTVLLLLAVLIALLGITNALALSIVERTKEVGVLRAVGMSRRQLGWMVRIEAALTATVGAFIGAALGVLVATATVQAQYHRAARSRSLSSPPSSRWPRPAESWPGSPPAGGRHAWTSSTPSRPPERPTVPAPGQRAPASRPAPAQHRARPCRSPASPTTA